MCMCMWVVVGLCSVSFCANLFRAMSHVANFQSRSLFIEIDRHEDKDDRGWLSWVIDYLKKRRRQYSYVRTNVRTYSLVLYTHRSNIFFPLEQSPKIVSAGSKTSLQPYSTYLTRQINISCAFFEAEKTGCEMHHHDIIWRVRMSIKQRRGGRPCNHIVHLKINHRR